MSDGRAYALSMVSGNIPAPSPETQMTATPKRATRIEWTIDATANTVTATEMRYSPETTNYHATERAPLMFDAGCASAPVTRYAALLGWQNRLRDAMALGAGSTNEEKFTASAALMAHYATGTEEWDMLRTRKAAAPLTDEQKKALAVKLLGELGITLDI